jgi:xanthine dehydrogenase YagT iron-sulfur-binding subunit
MKDEDDPIVTTPPDAGEGTVPEGSAESLDRRKFLGLSLGALPAMGLLLGGTPTDGPGAVAAVRASAETTAATRGSAQVDVVLDVNGRTRRLRLDARTTLLDALREELGLTGAKKGCDQGQCGACTVLVGDRRVLSCLMLAAMASEQRITTIEGLASADALHPVQAAFVAHDGFQCGFCTPGQILSAVGLLTEGCPAEPDAIRERMSGNLCRCGAYAGIVEAIQDARSRG